MTPKYTLDLRQGIFWGDGRPSAAEAARMENMAGKITIAITFLLLLAVGFLSLLFGAFSLEVRLSSQTGMSIALLALLALLITLLKSWSRWKSWFAIIAFEIVIIWLFRLCQPACEPCLPDVFCPPCTNDTQIFLKYLGIGSALAFLVFQMFWLMRQSHDGQRLKIRKR